MVTGNGDFNSNEIIGTAIVILRLSVVATHFDDW